MVGRLSPQQNEMCRDKRLANIASALALMVQTVEIGRCVVLTTCWYKTCDSRGEQHLRGKTEVFKISPPLEGMSNTLD